LLDPLEEQFDFPAFFTDGCNFGSLQLFEVGYTWEKLSNLVEDCGRMCHSCDYLDVVLLFALSI